MPETPVLLTPTRAKQKHGHYIPSPIGFIPWGFHFTVLCAIKVAEQELGRAPYIIEVAQVHKRISYFPTLPGMVAYAQYDLWRNDEILADYELTRVSTKPSR